jgi:NAD(P)-dependent dehydrogenase (short-subunit alcohol dehydrogenase family)
MSRQRPTALILGATSEIGRAIAIRLAEDGHALQLAARNREMLEREASDMEIRCQVPVTEHLFDALDPHGQEALLAGLPALPDVAVCVVGLLGDQKESECDLDAAERVLITNFTGPARILGELANRFEARGSGTIVGVSSVAGDRGRASNYVYGSAKAGLTCLLSGLRGRLARKGVHVVTVKPGFVQTRMHGRSRAPRTDRIDCRGPCVLGASSGSGGCGLCFGISGLTPKSTRNRRASPAKTRDSSNYFNSLTFMDRH